MDFNDDNDYPRQRYGNRYPRGGRKFNERRSGDRSGKRDKFNKYDKFDEYHEGNSQGTTHGRRPKHLKGKQIGLWYAARSKERRQNKTNEDIQKEKKQEDSRPLGNVLLSEKKKDHIRELLKKAHTEGDLEQTNKHFKSEFFHHISGSIIKSLELNVNKRSSYKNEAMDALLIEEFKKKQVLSEYSKMLEIRKKLPSRAKKDDILQLLNNHQVIVISGETGCGKTTQVAQFILDDFIENNRGSECKIVCTQPRRISAISVAERVAQERAETLGSSVGFQIRLERKPPRDRGSILFCTTGVLLKIMESDPAMTDISHIIIDEIHERDVISDFLITVLKYVILHRPDLKILLMSATINAEAFSKYYNNAPHINIPGFTHPVQEYYLEDVLQKTRFSFNHATVLPWMRKRRDVIMQNKNEYLDTYVRQLQAEKKYDRFVWDELMNPRSEDLNIFLVYTLVQYVCEKGEAKGSILVFLTGFGDIQTLVNMLRESKEFPRSKYIIIPLHSQLPTVDQKQIFNPAPKGKTKIIVSTNIAETSITIDDVTVVIDCGYIKMTNIDLETGIETLKPEWVSLANAAQRKGRAGRVQPGICYHLYTKAREQLLDKFQKPEVLRKRLDNVILQLKILQLGDAASFLGQLMDPPDPVNVTNSLQLLRRLGALDQEEALTPLGFHMAKLPLGAQCAKMLIMGAMFSCLDPILSVAASLDFKDGFQLNTDDHRQSDYARLELSRNTNSDHLLMHFAIKGFEEASNQHSFCRKYFLSFPIMNLLRDMRRQFAELLYEMKFIAAPEAKNQQCNRNSENLSLVKAVICAGLYPNVAILSKNKRLKITSVTHEKMDFHPKSILNRVTNISTPLLVYHHRLKSNKLYIHDGTLIYPLPLILFGDSFSVINNQSFTGVSINKTMRFICSESTSSLVSELRTSLNNILKFKALHPGPINWLEDTSEIKVLRAIMEIITSEDLEDFDLSDFEDC